MLVTRRGAAALFGAAAWTVLGSAAADPSRPPTKLECVAANERAQALRLQSSLVEARSQLLLCVDPSCPGPVRQDCADRSAELDRAMPTLRFDLVGGAGAYVALSIDGERASPHLEGEAISVNPGVHAFQFVGRDGRRAELTLAVQEGQKNRRVPVDMLAADAADPARPQRIVGETLVGVGVASLVIGTVLGLVAKSTYDDALSAQCHGNAQQCTALGVAGVDSAHTQAVGSTVGLIAGASTLAGGVALWATARASVRVAPTGGATLGLVGSF